VLLEPIFFRRFAPDRCSPPPTFAPDWCPRTLKFVPAPLVAGYSAFVQRYSKFVPFNIALISGLDYITSIYTLRNDVVSAILRLLLC